jgi:hypothetical protein
MNKSAIQKFAVWARNELIGQVSQRAYQYGIDKNGFGDENASAVAGRALSAHEQNQRKGFIAQIKRKGYDQAVEEAAYTWFNRFAALRFMEVNNYLPSHVRVFSDASGAFAPEILKDVLHLEMEGLDKDKVARLLNENAADDLYRYLLLTQCNALHSALPEMFEKMGGYAEMLLPNNILKQDGILARLVNDIPEEDWLDAVQIIGWLYQYYNTEPKQAVFDGLKKNVKISKENIPAATQLFTPDWIVRYMVENSLGRLWLEGHPNDALRAGWKYYLDEAEQEPEVQARLNEIREGYNRGLSPEDIQFIDPCAGSGHILVYAFDVFLQIYESAGYNRRDAAKLILEKNLYGLDIDKRACQLACFALTMKARQHNRRIFTENVRPRVYHPAGFPDGEEYGSLLRIADPGERPAPAEGQQLLPFEGDYETNLRVWNFKSLLARKYDVVCTNPPYMGSSGMNGKLLEFMKSKYPDSKSDLFAAFIERCGEFAEHDGCLAMITQHAWMFLSSYENLREKLHSFDTTSMAHLGPRAFAEIAGEVVQSATFVMRKRYTKGYKGTYVRLVDFNDAEQKELEFLSGRNRYTASADNFAKIPGSPVAYWAGEKVFDAFNNKSIYSISVSASKNVTGNNAVFLRFFWEVENKRIDKNVKWIFCAKGGGYRKWMGNLIDVINWTPQARELYRTGHASQIVPENYWYKKGITWGLITSNIPSFRILPVDSTFDSGGLSIFISNDENFSYVLGLLNSKVFLCFAKILNPTLNFLLKDIRSMPLVIKQKQRVDNLVINCCNVSQTDWDSFETSWDFKRHPLIPLLRRGAAVGGGVVGAPASPQAAGATDAVNTTTPALRATPPREGN